MLILPEVTPRAAETATRARNAASAMPAVPPHVRRLGCTTARRNRQASASSCGLTVSDPTEWAKYVVGKMKSVSPKKISAVAIGKRKTKASANSPRKRKM